MTKTDLQFFVVLVGTLPLLLLCKELAIHGDETERVKRTATNGYQSHNIEVSLPFYDGADVMTDSCSRNQVPMNEAKNNSFITFPTTNNGRGYGSHSNGGVGRSPGHSSANSRASFSISNNGGFGYGRGSSSSSSFNHNNGDGYGSSQSSFGFNTGANGGQGFGYSRSSSQRGSSTSDSGYRVGSTDGNSNFGQSFSRSRYGRSTRQSSNGYAYSRSSSHSYRKPSNAGDGYGQRKTAKCETLILSQVSCSLDEIVLQDPDTKEGYCAPRLCPPDRIFLFTDQLCHDAKSPNVCPSGRELRITSTGMPICQCPGITYETENDRLTNVCEPLLSPSSKCPPGKVLWFQDFRTPISCVSDPCDGFNLKKNAQDPPFVPSEFDGKCYQLGSLPGVCPPNTEYTLDLTSLKGVCATAEEAGYETYDENALQELMRIYGPFLMTETEFTKVKARLVGKISVSSKQSLQGFFKTLQSPNDQDFNQYLDVARSLLSQAPGTDKQHSQHRWRRQTGVGSTFDGMLVKCRSGAAVDANGKCQNIVRAQSSGGSRPPIPPTPPCAGRYQPPRRECDSNISNVG